MTHEPIKVLLTAPAPDRIGGVAQYVRVLQPHLRSRVDCITVGSRSSTERAPRAALRMVSDCWRFYRTLISGRHELVHLNPSLLPKALLRDGVLLLIAKALRRSVVVFTHGWDRTCYRALRDRFRPLFRSVFGRADAFIVLANEFEMNLRSLGYTRPVYVRAAPIADDLLEASASASLALPGGDPDKFAILFLARLEAAKGIYEALDAFQLVQARYPYAQLIVAGDGAEAARVREYAAIRRIGGVEFVGHVSGQAKHKVFAAADAYLFPSHTEGLPISVLEAMAFGLPVVTTAVGGLCDFFEDGRMGFLTHERDPRVFASLLEQLLSDRSLCARMGQLNYEYVRRHFTPARVAAEIERVYRLVYQGSH